MAAGAGKLEAVEWILAQPDGGTAIGVASSDAGRTALHSAAVNGHADVVACMLRHPEGQAALSCRETNGHTPVHLAIINAHVRVIAAVLQHWEGRATVRCAITPDPP